MTDTTERPDEQGAAAPADPSGAIVAPPKKELGAAGRVAAGVSAKGFGVDPDADDGVPHAGLRLAGLVATLVAVGVLNRWMLVVILGLVTMITLHEFGHYYMAKRAGMKVTEFFLGFGPKIWSTRRGETEYGIKLIPAGAYVKIPGMTNLEEIAPEDEARTYRQKNFRQRVGVAVAGSTMHFILALVLIFVALAAVGQPGGTMDPTVRAEQWRISAVTDGTGAKAARLRKGDRILSIDGKAIPTFDALRSVTKPLKGKTVPMVFERAGKRIATTVHLKPFYSWSVQSVGKGTSTLQPYDQITKINGTPTSTFRDLDEQLAAIDGKRATITYERGASSTPHAATVTVDALTLSGHEGYVGIGQDEPPVERLGVGQSLVETPKQFASLVQVSLQGLGKFFSPGGISDFAGQVGHARKDHSAVAASTVANKDGRSSSHLETSSEAGVGSVNPNRVMSIVGLVHVGSASAAVDPAGLITLFAVINIFIGVFNLAPLLPFDGGHVVLAVYEKIQEVRLRRRRYFADVGRLLPVVYAVTLLLVLLFVSTIYLDLANPLSV
ncbi:MAG: peptidase [Acidimicrobiales bacterium]|nr:peptidase [Acidimicrobiales bacterium]